MLTCTGSLFWDRAATGTEPSITVRTVCSGSLTGLRDTGVSTREAGKQLFGSVVCTNRAGLSPIWQEGGDVLCMVALPQYLVIARLCEVALNGQLRQDSLEHDTVTEILPRQLMGSSAVPRVIRINCCDGV